VRYPVSAYAGWNDLSLTAAVVCKIRFFQEHLRLALKTIK